MLEELKPLELERGLNKLGYKAVPAERGQLS